METEELLGMIANGEDSKHQFNPTWHFSPPNRSDFA